LRAYQLIKYDMEDTITYYELLMLRNSLISEIENQASAYNNLEHSKLLLAKLTSLPAGAYKLVKAKE
jgi:hypothetical protein